MRREKGNGAGKIDGKTERECQRIFGQIVAEIERGATYTGRTSQKESVYLKVKNYFWSFFTPFWMTTPL